MRPESPLGLLTRSLLLASLSTGPHVLSHSALSYRMLDKTNCSEEEYQELLRISANEISFNFSPDNSQFIPLGKNIQLDEVAPNSFAGHVINELAPFYSLPDHPVTLNSGVLIANDAGEYLTTSEDGLVWVKVSFPISEIATTADQEIIFDEPIAYAIGTTESGAQMKINGRFLTLAQTEDLFDQFLDYPSLFLQASFAAAPKMHLNYGGTNWQYINLPPESSWAAALIVGPEIVNLDNQTLQFTFPHD